MPETIDFADYTDRKKATAKGAEEGFWFKPFYLCNLSVIGGEQVFLLSVKSG
ncbi:hypothetical protein KSU1_D0897 [Candidatus Jettenia caeni]|uniref:Uncharacterized protein n=1 Tax=Candidatus Jettenia caeni TaxID=247490 RepID=I3IR61_9BACT|nr:hypothetical protein KSU1_D0897 [Candidatus Jettenia caeni]GIL20197.1 MAG: hypothetical protein BroJett041_13110 [Candidatus Jettenia caeni]GJQ44921.1 MAG: hypothetical protein JETCAE04_06750 [Candidatus Jettenia caeni]